MEAYHLWLCPHQHRQVFAAHFTRSTCWIGYSSEALRVARRFPEIELGMIEESRARLATALRNGAIDIAIVTGETHLPHTKSMFWPAESPSADGHEWSASDGICSI
jgi:hypothetical protein